MSLKNQFCLTNEFSNSQGVASTPRIYLTVAVFRVWLGTILCLKIESDAKRNVIAKLSHFNQSKPKLPRYTSKTVSIGMPFSMKVHETVETAHHDCPAPTSGLLIAICAKWTHFVIYHFLLRCGIQAIASGNLVASAKNFFAVPQGLKTGLKTRREVQSNPHPLRKKAIALIKLIKNPSLNIERAKKITYHRIRKYT